MENLCDSATNGGEGTYDVLYLPTNRDRDEEIKMKRDKNEETERREMSGERDTLSSTKLIAAYYKNNLFISHPEFCDTSLICIYQPLVSLYF